MLKAFAEYLVGLKDNKLYTVHGETYSDNKLTRIAKYIPRPNRITVNSLDSVAFLTQREIKRLPAEALPIFIQVCDARHINVFSGLDGDMERYDLYFAACDAPMFKPGWRDYNTAIIELRSMFKENEGSAYLLDLLSRISKEDGVTTTDNGVTQQVEARSGIALKAKESIRPRVKLIPFRTFTEVEQPESEFLTRVDDNGNIGFFEADGGAWALAAKGNIARYISMMLSTLIDDGSVVVMV